MIGHGGTESSHRFRAGWLAIGILAALVLPTPTAAARPLTFSLWMDHDCVSGRAPDDARVSVVWRGADGELKQKGTVRADSDGYWVYCGDRDELTDTGDTVKAKVGTRQRTVTIPRIRLVIDRVADDVHGKTTPNTDIRLWAGTTRGFGALDWTRTDLTTDDSGAFGTTLPVDLHGYDAVELDVATAKGDVFALWQRVPYLRVGRGKPTVTGVFRPNRELSIALQDGTLSTKDVVTTRASFIDGEYWARFADPDGDRIPVQAGDHVVSAQIGADADITVPAVSISINKRTDVVSGTCIPYGYYEIDAWSPDGKRSGSRLGRANDSGAFSKDLTTKIDLRTGDIVWVSCRMPTGDIVNRRAIVP